ncbi:hypothetical protein DEU56DRAFT_183417 [Suillus clintonianus]|uniref:uncharacterized protein n=1 Tax=Suillus clintonianus TaxID=1904413 RepID=UPI001B8779E1|nr:uncharacterized protein DEU56DRAFT_183417 [Suillus clintonianus]KAG2145833.1 hypothetical protein DEU56DRAFT_183417 [Suillus clintonianus]
MSSSTQDLIAQLDIGRTFGALFIGATIAAVLFGLSNVQVFIYFQTHRGTGTTFYKLFVIWLWILDALHLALVIHCVYYYLVINYANISALTHIIWSFKLCDTSQSRTSQVLIIYEVHLLYVYRIWIVSKGRSRIFPIAAGAIVILGLGVAIALIWAIYQCQLFSDLIKIEWSTYVTLGTITVADIVIASSLCYLLATSRTGFASTDSLITKLMAYIINTGILTSICSMAVMITCAVMPNNFIFLGIEFLVAKLYVNSYLALLNARYYVQANADTSNSYQFNNVYRPELHVMASQDEELQASRRDIFKHPDEEGYDGWACVCQRCGEREESCPLKVNEYITTSLESTQMYVTHEINEF